jgi:dihydrofolate reductase
MRQLLLQEFVSLDGMAAGPNDSVDFIPGSTQGDANFGREQLALMDRVDALVLGRVTYEMFAQYWPSAGDVPGPEKEFAEKFNSLSRIVFSKRLERAPWGRWKEGRVVARGAVEEIASLKQQPGKDLLLSGSVSLAQALMDADAIDEYRLVLCPIVLAGGRPLFRTSADRRLKLVKSTAMERGAVSLVYARG